MHDTMGSDLEDDEQSEVLLQIQLTDQSKITILFNLNKTVEEFKWAVADLTEILPNEQNLVYRGHILENSYTLKSYGLEQDQIIDVVRRVRPPSTSISSDLIIHLGRRGPPLNMSIGFLSRKCGLDNTRNGLSDKKPQLQPILNTAASIIREIPILSQISNEQGMKKMLGNRLTLRKTLWYLLFLKLLKVRKGVASRKADIMRTVKAFSEESERLKRNHVLQGISHQSEANQLSCDLMGLNLVGTSSCVTKSSNANQSCSAPNIKPLPNPWFACSSRGIFLWNEHTSVLSLWRYLKNDSNGRERALDDFVHMLLTETSFLRHYKEQHNSIDLAVTAMLGSDYAGVSDILHDADLPYETLGNIASENLLAGQLAEMVRDLLLYGMDMEEAIKKRLGAHQIVFSVSAIINSDEHPTMSYDEADRMSTLPDELLLHILSFLGTKEAVQMSLVSKRWMHLWAFVPCLNFDIEEFGFMDEPVTFNNLVGLINYMRDSSVIQAKFLIFVEMVLSRHKSCSLNTFQIRYPWMPEYDRCSDLVRTGVRCALRSNARGFSLEALIPSVESCAPIFTSQSIEEMCLKISTREGGDFNAEIIPEVVNLPRIRVLQLKKSMKPTQLDETSITRLLSGCPVLEELFLEYCVGKFSSIFRQKLKILSLYDCCMELPHGGIVMWKFYRAIIKPNIPSTVESTFIVDFLPNVLLHFIWSSLDGAAMDSASSFIHHFIQNLNFGNCNDLLCGLSSVTMLELCSRDLKSDFHQDHGVLETVLPRLGEFHNLRNFSLSGWCTPCNFNQVASFLQKAPNLENLTLCDCGRRCQMADPETYYHLIWVELSRCSKLKRVEIKILTDHIEAQRFEEAWVSGRTELENVEVVLSEYNAPVM